MLRKSPPWTNTSRWSCRVNSKTHTICLGWDLLPEVHYTRLSFSNVLATPPPLPCSWHEESSLTGKLEKRCIQGMKQGEASFCINTVFLLTSWQEQQIVSKPQLSGVETPGTKVHPSSSKQDLLCHLQGTVCVPCVQQHLPSLLFVCIEICSLCCHKCIALPPLLPRYYAAFLWNQSFMSIIGTYLFLFSMNMR